MKKLFLISTAVLGLTVSHGVTNAQGLATSSSSTPVTCNGGNNGTATTNPTGGTAPYTFSWSPSGQTTQTVSFLSVGTYIVTITDAVGGSVSDAVTITQPTVLVIGQTSTSALCFGDCNGTVTLTASGGTPPYTYSGTTSGLCAGTYFFIVTDANGCTAQTSATITQPAPLMANSTTQSASCQTCCDGTATVNPSGGTPPYAYSWSVTPPQITSTITGLCAGTYTVCVTDFNGCSTCQSIVVTAPSGINEVIKSNSLTISPNPFSSQTTLQTDIFFHNATLTVDNCFGQTVAQIKNLRGQTIVFNRDNLVSGLYFVRLTEENKTIAVDKLVIADK